MRGPTCIFLADLTPFSVKASAVAAWNASALQFMVRTLETARALRPRARWAYYGMLGCAAKWDVAAGECAESWFLSFSSSNILLLCGGGVVRRVV
jgi:hypothetical protein